MDITRVQIIEEILQGFLKENNTVKVDLAEFREIFIKRHTPLEDVIEFLCNDCHDKIHQS
jgi:hypothetical protein